MVVHQTHAHLVCELELTVEDFLMTDGCFLLGILMCYLLAADVFVQKEGPLTGDIGSRTTIVTFEALRL